MIQKTKTLIRSLGIGIFILFLQINSVLAQSNYKPPTVLPNDDTNLGGFGDECIGLGHMISTGDIHLRNVPCFLKYFAETLIALGGTLAVVFIIIGGYRYVFGFEEDKGGAKNTILYALIGLVVSLSAWVLVDIVLQIITE